MNQNNSNSNWKTLLGFRNLKEKLENNVSSNFIEIANPCNAFDHDKLHFFVRAFECKGRKS